VSSRRSPGAYAYNFGAVTVTHVRADVPLKPGAHIAEVRFTYDGGGLGRVDRTVPFFFSMDQTLNVGIDRGTPVSQDYAGRRGFPYTGRIVNVDLVVGDDTVHPDPEDLAEAALVAH
jgi:arylsulfatase